MNKSGKKPDKGEPKMHNDTTIDPVEDKWQFTCECGVKGPLRNVRGDAETDLQAHIDAQQGE